MRRSKRDRDKPIPKSDLDKIAVFRVELEAMAKLKTEGKTHKEATAIVWAEYMPPKKRCGNDSIACSNTSTARARSGG